MAKSNSREHLLDAAEEVVISEGAAHLTLDAVAERAGMSKGGVLYHFPSKESLLTAMLQRLIELGRRRRAECLETTDPVPARMLHAHLQCRCGSDERLRKVAVSLLAAVANDPRLVEPMRPDLDRDMKELFTGIEDFESAAILFLASEGISKLLMMGCNPFTDEQLERIRAALLRRSRELK